MFICSPLIKPTNDTSAWLLHPGIFQELDSLAGFEADPVPPPVPTTAAAPSAVSAAAAAKAAGCPFAHLAAAGVAMPEGHGGVQASAVEGVKAS